MVFGSIYKISLEKKKERNDPLDIPMYVTYVEINLETMFRETKNPEKL